MRAQLGRLHPSVVVCPRFLHGSWRYRVHLTEGLSGQLGVRVGPQLRRRLLAKAFAAAVQLRLKCRAASGLRRVAGSRSGRTLAGRGSAAAVHEHAEECNERNATYYGPDPDAGLFSGAEAPIIPARASSFFKRG